MWSKKSRCYQESLMSLFQLVRFKTWVPPSKQKHIYIINYTTILYAWRVSINIAIFIHNSFSHDYPRIPQKACNYWLEFSWVNQRMLTPQEQIQMKDSPWEKSSTNLSKLHQPIPLSRFLGSIKLDTIKPRRIFSKNKNRPNCWSSQAVPPPPPRRVIIH